MIVSLSPHKPPGTPVKSRPRNALSSKEKTVNSYLESFQNVNSFISYFKSFQEHNPTYPIAAGFIE